MYISICIHTVYTVYIYTRKLGESCRVTQGAQPSALGKRGRGGWDGGVGGRFKRDGVHANLWLIHAVVWQKPAQHCKAIILQLKINLKKPISVA